MPDTTVIPQQVFGTGTWNIDAPISFFSFATYKTAKGKIVQVPIQVAGEKITGATLGMAQPQS